MLPLDIPFQTTWQLPWTGFLLLPTPRFLRGVSGTSTGQGLLDLAQLCPGCCSLFHSPAAQNKRDKWGIHQHSPGIPRLQEECPTVEFRSREGSLDKFWGRLKFSGFGSSKYCCAGVISARFAYLINKWDKNSEANSNCWLDTEEQE